MKLKLEKLKRVKTSRREQDNLGISRSGSFIDETNIGKVEKG